MSEEKQNEIPQVGAVDPEKKNSNILDTYLAEEEELEDTKGFCWFNGNKYSSGASICSGRSKLLCYPNGGWVKIGKC